ncbi:MAG TPA: NlpC/P60 family protein [Virgibacillus sp.]|nr:NlpC/P60 family protein [Virgibacillus sp.]
MKKTFITLTTVAVVGLGSTFFSDSVHADTIGELQDKQSEIKDERSKIKKDLSKAEAEIADVLIDLEELNKEIDQLNDALKHNEDMMKETKESIKQSEEEIIAFEQEIQELEEKIEFRSEILKERVASYQKSGGNINYLDVIFGSKSFGEMISRISAVTTITNSDKELIEEQENDKEKVADHKKKVEEKLAEQNDLKVELEGMELLIVDQKEQNEKNKKELKSKEKEIKDLVSELKSEDRTLAELEATVKSQLNSAQNPSTSGGNLTTVASASPSTSSNDNASKAPSKSSGPVKGSGSVNVAINAGYQYLGVPYRTAGKTPSGFDCSGFVSWAYGQAGYNLPSHTEGLRTIGQKVSYSQAQPGDLIFFDTYKRDGHVAIYLGGGQFLGSQSSTGLAVASVSNTYWSKAFKGHVRRIN